MPADQPAPPSTPPLLRLAPMVAELEGTRGGAWAVTARATALQREGIDVIDLGVGDPDFATPPPIVEALERSLRAGRTHYAPAEGERPLREAIASDATRRLGCPVDPNAVLVFPGAQCALFATLMCLVGPGDEVILLEPAYTTYERCVLAVGAVPVSVGLDPADGFALDVDQVVAAFGPRTRAIVVNTPNNPSGAVFGPDALSALTEHCAARGVWVVSDEVYAALVFEGRHHSPLATPAGPACAVVVNSLSKSHAMTGWRLGWAHGPEPVTKALRSLTSSLLYGTNQFVQDAAVVALTDARNEADHMARRFMCRRDALLASLAGAPGVIVHRPRGGMFVFADIHRTGVTGVAFADALLDRQRVVVVPGAAFGEAAASCLRIGLTVDEDRLRAAGARITEVARDLAS
ncbi:MAG: aminotransferase class I/II-fold pyridoxal phosphate-dependent enzyme [Pseudomonadota bacterium]